MTHRKHVARTLRRGDWMQVTDQDSIDVERYGKVIYQDTDTLKGEVLPVVALALDHGDRIVFYRWQLRALPRRKSK